LEKWRRAARPRHGEPGEITVCEATRLALGERFEFVDRGTVKVKGKGEMKLYFLLGAPRAGPLRRPVSA